MLDPRIEANAEDIQRIKRAITVLAATLDSVAWRVSTEEERKAGVEISEQIREILGVSKK